jgi:predicted RNase H-like HicB family nuclease
MTASLRLSRACMNWPASLFFRHEHNFDQRPEEEAGEAMAQVSLTLPPMKTYQEFGIDYFQDEDGVFTARVPAIKGCIAWGKTLEEAYRNAVDAIESCLEAREKVSALKLRKPRYAGMNIYSRPVNA